MSSGPHEIQVQRRILPAPGQIRVRSSASLAGKAEGAQCGDVLYIPPELHARLAGAGPNERVAILRTLDVTFWPGLSAGGDQPIVVVPTPVLRGA